MKPTREMILTALENSYMYSCVDEENVIVPQEVVMATIDYLQAQEAIEPIYNGDCEWDECPNCGYVLSKQYNPCPGCGRPVKWDE